MPTRHAPATARNRDPILHVLRDVLPRQGEVLEIASGTGEHALYFAEHFPSLGWQPSDPKPEARESIAAWAATTSLKNLRSPIALDVRDEVWPIEPVDAVVCINMIHIAPWECCVDLMRGAKRVLRQGAPLYLYGPYKIGGRHTAPSNEAFDQRLRGEDAAWGVRDLEAVIDAAQVHGFELDRTVEMPANNLSVVFVAATGESDQVGHNER